MDKLKQLAAKGNSFAEQIKRLLGRMEKQQKKRVLAAVCAGVLILTLAVMPMMAAGGNEEDGVKASILSGMVESGSITTTIHGGGVLAEEDGRAIRLPDGVKITKFLVDNYAEVKQGDALASVDKVTVMQAISGVQETLEYLKEEIEDAGNNTVTKTITAEAGGKVKAVYAQKGDDVTAVMTEYGALAVLSLDGMMAVDIETNADLSAGDTVWVGFEDGRDVVGRVESALNGEVVITVEDDDYAIGEHVVITDSDDDRLGEGTLYVHNAWNAVAYSGTVSSVNLKENTTVSAGKTIFNLKEVENSSRFQTLSRQHREYEELMLELFVMYQSGALLAPCDGVVTGVDKDSVHLLSDSGSTYTVSLLANAPGENADASYQNYVGQIVLTGESWSVNINAAEVYTDIDYKDLSGVNQNPADMTEKNKLVNPVPVYKLGEDGTWSETIAATGDILLFALDSNRVVWAVYMGHADISAEPSTTPEVSPAVSPSPSVQPDSGAVAPEVSPSPEGDQNVTQQMPSGSSSMGSFGGLSGTGSIGSGVQEETSELYDLSGTDILFVTPQNTVTLTVTLDETDIGRIAVGQQAVITVDVLKGEEFIGTVTEIGTTGTNSGGNSKYTVELALERAENMLAGQSASAVFTADTAEHVLVVPVAALTENGSETVIYTAKSGDTLTKPVTVITGASDGEFVEICSGLEDGQTYYYTYYDTLELSTAVEKSGMFGR